MAQNLKLFCMKKNKEAPYYFSTITVILTANWECNITLRDKLTWLTLTVPIAVQNALRVVHRIFCWRGGRGGRGFSCAPTLHVVHSSRLTRATTLTKLGCICRQIPL